MEMKQISETTLKITISMEDLEERGMELKDFLIPQEKTEEFFYSVMDELDLPDNFKDSGMLSFRVTPRKDRIDVFVTKSEINKDINFEDLAAFDDVSNMSPEEFFKTLEQIMLSKGDTEAHEKLGKIEEMMEGAVEDVNPSDYVHYVLDFPSLEATVAFAKAIDFPVEASELYKMDGAYYMTVLIDLQNHPSYYANLMYARMLEYAGAGTKTRAYLQEHAVELLTDDTVEKLKMIELV
ncbi:negative regulator of competence [Streptococcus infantarius subsp. infantarius]|nr:negative regulator of competence [Streptococcus infantarius subsp. infantarius]MCO4637489.1 negative regulator of competence [Streptococcus infantarius subsp. infantarius]MCO4641477.1 negative regulator of competence [Streptococcus infantarius subsp. infantarius]MCO4644055.1 negative regulator of competence [Streptococcus infantarius subsp. infantarius]MCO4651751.1 negative regulator of competence [Streptococcus infantarius subsp. infantarius]